MRALKPSSKAVTAFTARTVSVTPVTETTSKLSLSWLSPTQGREMMRWERGRMEKETRWWEKEKEKEGKEKINQQEEEERVSDEGYFSMSYL